APIRPPPPPASRIPEAHAHLRHASHALGPARRPLFAHFRAHPAPLTVAFRPSVHLHREALRESRRVPPPRSRPSPGRVPSRCRFLPSDGLPVTWSHPST